MPVAATDASRFAIVSLVNARAAGWRAVHYCGRPQEAAMCAIAAVRSLRAALAALDHAITTD